MSAQQAALAGTGPDPSEKRAHQALDPGLDALPDAPSRPLGPRSHSTAWNSKRVLRLTLRHVLQNARLSGRPPLHRKWQENLENGSKSGREHRQDPVCFSREGPSDPGTSQHTPHSCLS